MKKILFSFLCLASALGTVQAQKFNNGAKSKLADLFAEQKYDVALEEIAKYEANTKNSDNHALPMFKLYTLGRIISDSILSVKFPNATDEALTIFKTMQEKIKDTAAFNKLLKDDNNAGFNGLYSIYVKSYMDGSMYFGENAYVKSYNNFELANDIARFIYENNFATNPNKVNFDENAVVNAGHAAFNVFEGKDPSVAKGDSTYYNNAMSHYLQIVNNNLKEPSLAGAYQIVTKDYIAKEQLEKARKLIDFARPIYAEHEAFWREMENQLLAKDPLDKQLMNYQTQKEADALDKNRLITYAERFSKHLEKEKPELAKQARLAALDCYERLYKLEQDPVYLFNAGIVYYNIFDVLEEEIRAYRGEDASKKVKRNEIRSEQKAISDKAVEKFLKTVEACTAKTELNNTEKGMLKNSYRILTNIYEWKANQERGVNPKLVDKYVELFEKYDDLFFKS